MEEQKVYSKYLVSLTKIIAVYSFLYVILRMISIFFLGFWKIPNAVLAIPFLLLGLLSTYVIIQKKYNWSLMIMGIFLIVIVRIYEPEIIFYLHQKL